MTNLQGLCIWLTISFILATSVSVASEGNGLEIISDTSQTDSRIKDNFFDYTVGNKWTYRIQSEDFPSVEYKSIEIKSCENQDSIISCDVENFGTLIIDENTSLVSDFFSNQIGLVDQDPGLWKFYDTDMEVDSVWHACWDCSTSDNTKGVIFDTSTVSVFGVDVKQKSINLILDYVFVSHVDMVEKFGMQYYTPGEGESWVLVGAYIDGILYGDTTIVTSATTVDHPNEIQLHQNYPNPFNPSTIIGYELPGYSQVKLEVYDIIGRRITTLVNEPQHAGVHEVIWDANGLASGVYIYRLQAGDFVRTRQMLFLK